MREKEREVQRGKKKMRIKSDWKRVTGSQVKMLIKAISLLGTTCYQCPWKC